MATVEEIRRRMREACRRCTAAFFIKDESGVREAQQAFYLWRELLRLAHIEDYWRRQPMDLKGKGK